MGAEVIGCPVSGVLPPELELLADRLEEVPSSLLKRDGCVYFLLRGDRVTYVGSTLHLLTRLHRHRQDGKQFDRVLFLEMPAAEIARVEEWLIHALKPADNKKSPFDRLKVKDPTLAELFPTLPRPKRPRKPWRPECVCYFRDADDRPVPAPEGRRYNRNACVDHAARMGLLVVVYSGGNDEELERHDFRGAD